MNIISKGIFSSQWRFPGACCNGKHLPLVLLLLSATQSTLAVECLGMGVDVKEDNEVVLSEDNHLCASTSSVTVTNLTVNKDGRQALKAPLITIGPGTLIEPGGVLIGSGLDISGIYQGTYSGSHSGTWTVNIADTGPMTGTITTSSSDYFGVSGNAENNGAFVFNASGSVASVTFNGSIHPLTGELSCTWQDSQTSLSGNCSGSKLIPDATDQPLDLLDYFPLSKGSYWIHDAKDQGASSWQWQSKDIMENTELIHGVSAIQRVYYDSDYENMQKPDDYDLLSYDAQHLYLHGSNQVGNPSWNDDPLGLSVFNPPVSFKRLLKQNQTTGSSSIITDPNGNKVDGAISFTLLGFEDVTVTAGSFTDCAKIMTVFQQSDAGEASIDWWAKGVGTVKSISTDSDGDTDLSELNHYYVAP